MSKEASQCCLFCRKLHKENVQLSESLENANERLSAIVSVNERLEGEAEKQKIKEEGLFCLLQEKEKKVTELQQAYDAQCQELQDIAERLKV